MSNVSHFASQLTLFFAETPKFDLDVYIANYTGEYSRPFTYRSIRDDMPLQEELDSVGCFSLELAHRSFVLNP